MWTVCAVVKTDKSTSIVNQTSHGGRRLLQQWLRREARATLTVIILDGLALRLAVGLARRARFISILDLERITSAVATLVPHQGVSGRAHAVRPVAGACGGDEEVGAAARARNVISCLFEVVRVAQHAAPRGDLTVPGETLALLPLDGALRRGRVVRACRAHLVAADVLVHVDWTGRAAPLQKVVSRVAHTDLTLVIVRASIVVAPNARCLGCRGGNKVVCTRGARIDMQLVAVGPRRARRARLW